jgi:hypothetical protein
MSSAPTVTLTLEQYHAEYAGESGYEAIRKPMPTWLHAVLQALLGDVFYRLGYFSGSELTLRVDAQWEPRPDVAAAVELTEPYPTRPVDILAEILSPDDTMAFVFKKCRSSIRKHAMPGNRAVRRTIWSASPSFCWVMERVWILARSGPNWTGGSVARNRNRTSLLLFLLLSQ